ncbi:hypothetical protein LCGC14_1484350 [marine sediment metagenome]|uniref:Uncharacterized protein n=1 Tax=marine sediment metagenome TaxID=412755 RepID=A0A0F9MAD1_9ZZZZ|nr:hypothetical protein [Desulfobacterales bacterium]
MGKLYRLGSGGMEEIKPDGKNDLAIGTRLWLSGYGDSTNYIIVKNMGVNEKFQGYGARYLCVNPETLEQSSHDAYEIDPISTKKDGRIHLYIMEDEPRDAEDVAELFKQSEALRKRKAETQRLATERVNEAIEKGRVIIAAKKPAWAKAVIVGFKEIDDCDMMTDYFNTKSGPAHLLAWSKHTKDIFSEMRKAAANHPETEHLVNAPKEAEHREKYSMGAGYYLKAARTYSTGWKVKKMPLSYYEDQLYQIVGEGRCCIPEK